MSSQESVSCSTPDFVYLYMVQLRHCQRGKKIMLMFLFSCLFGPILKVTAQFCDNKSLKINFNTEAWQQFNNVSFATANDIIVTGITSKGNTNALLAKFTKNGIPLWANDYRISYFSLFFPLTFFNKFHIIDVAPADNGAMIVFGSVNRFYQDPGTGAEQPIAILAKIDAVGNVVWSKTYISNGGIPALGFNQIIRTASGDYIAYLAVDYGLSVTTQKYSFNRIVCFDGSGVIKWSANLSTGEYGTGGQGVLRKRAMTQTADKNILIADVVYKLVQNAGQFKITEGRLHFISLHAVSGKIMWESSMPYTVPSSDPLFVPDIEQVQELPNGNLFFATSLYVDDNGSYIKKPVAILTDNKGNVQNFFSYAANNTNAFELTNAVLNSNNQIEYLFSNGNNAVVTTLLGDGTVKKTVAYTGTYPPDCFAHSNRGLAIFLSNNQSNNFELLLTDSAGNLDCATANVTVTKTEIPVSQFDPAAVKTAADVINATSFKLYFTDAGYGVKKNEPYILNRNVQCEPQVNCCTDIVDLDNSRPVHICEGSTYYIPGNGNVSDSGIYAAVFKTSLGCDSVLYYKIMIDKNTNFLTLGSDTCLTTTNSFLLDATPGFEKYNWMGVITSSNTFRVNSTGKYWVTVSNSCGVKTDTVNVYEQCDFPVYIPSAFSPNNDNLNDRFGFPSANKSKFVSLKVFNRWGQEVFATTKATESWDGNYKGTPAPADVYVFTLVTETLSGKRKFDKKTLMLIR